jgi:hypothetical protein
MVAVDLDGIQLVLFDLDIFALFQFVTAGLLFAFDDVAGLGINHLLFEPVAGFLVDHVEAGFVRGSCGRIEQYRT